MGPVATTETAGPAPPIAMLGTVALIALPAVATVYLSFHAGGFFPATPALVALVLGQIMVLRTTSGERPLAGYSRSLAIAATALALYALWGLSSALWSHALGRALIEFDRALMYLLALVVFGSLRWTHVQARWMLRAFALALVAVCTVALMSRLLPNVVPTSTDLAANRLSYPLTYWNALGLVAALTVVTCLFLASDERSGLAIRVFGAAALPVAATTLLFTFSRGGIVACVLGLLVFVLVARPRGLPAALLAVSVPLAVALTSAYDASLLAGLDPTSPAAVVQGHHVARVVGLCVLAAAILRLLLWRLDRRMARLDVPRPSRRAVTSLAAGAVLAAVVIVFATGLSDGIGRGYRDFVHNNNPGKRGDLRARLTDPSNNGRVEHWRVAVNSFADSPLKGTGLGTYELQWARDRPSTLSVINAHSLYLETLSDLGVIGALLLLVGLGSVLVAFARRARGPERALYGTLLAAGVAWAFECGVDWNWQMPATTLWLFAFGGVALSRRDPPAKRVGAERWRLLAGACWLALLVTPLLVYVSQSRVHQAANRFAAGDCAGATTKALSSLSALDVSPMPYEILGYCDMRDGRANTAVRAMREATRRDPGSWEATYGLALALASAGRDPTRELRLAVRQNPRETLLRTERAALEAPRAERRQEGARRAREAVLASGRLTLSAR